jgi:hypothetical protein
LSITYPNLIVSSLGHVSNPLDRLVVGLFKDFQEPDK